MKYVQINTTVDTNIYETFKLTAFLSHRSERGLIRNEIERAIKEWTINKRNGTSQQIGKGVNK